MLEFYLSNEYWFAATQLILAMFGMGATLTPKDFKDVFVEPLAVTAGTVIQLATVPLATFVFLSAFDINAGVAVGIALIAAIPGGTASATSPCSGLLGKSVEKLRRCSSSCNSR